MSNKLKPRPEFILGPQGNAQKGAYTGGFDHALITKPLSFSMSGIKQALGHKSWFFIGIGSEDFFVSCAIADVGYAGNAFITVVDLKNGKTLKDVSFIGMPKLNLHVNDYPGEGARAFFKRPGSKIEIQRIKGSSFYQVDLNLMGFKLSATLETSGAPDTLAVIGGQNEHQFAFTQKSNLLSVKGEMKLGKKKWDLENALGSIDYSSGIYPRIIHWYWGFAQGRLPDGRGIGFNLAKGNNLGGQLENVLWIKDKMYALTEADFIFEKKNLMSEWKMKTADGLIDLRFTPKGIHQEHKDLKIVKSEFSQVIGVFDGMIKDPETKEIFQISGLPGIGEDQYIKW